MSRSTIREPVVENYLACGILEHGFARVRCGACKYEFLLAFSRKCRYFCPSCHAKQMVLEESIDAPCGEAKSHVIALVVGGGLNLAVGGRTVVIDGRYTRDLVSISGGGSWKNRVFALSVGLAFGTASR